MLLSTKDKGNTLTIRNYGQLLLLILFLQPILIKGLHFHDYDYDNSVINYSHTLSLTNLHAKCIIYEYQLSHFVEEETVQNSSIVPVIFIPAFHLVQRFESSTFSYFQNRAPPTYIS